MSIKFEGLSLSTSSIADTCSTRFASPPIARAAIVIETRSESRMKVGLTFDELLLLALRISILFSARFRAQL